MTGMTTLRAAAADLRRDLGEITTRPRVRVEVAAPTDIVCRHCDNGLNGVAMRRTCTRPECRAVRHVSVLCADCTVAQTWGDHASALSDADKAELRQVAHRVGGLRRGAA